MLEGRGQDISEVELAQKAQRTRIKYRFFPDFVEYAIHDARGDEASFQVKYAEIPSKFEYRVFRPRQVDVAVLLALLLTMQFLIGGRQWSWHVLAGMAAYGTAVIGLTSYVSRKYLRKFYTAIPTRGGRLLVLRDKRHDHIIGELESRRRQILRKFAMVDVSHTPAFELRKLSWLKEEGVITAEEYAANCRLLGAVETPAPPVPAAEEPPTRVRQRGFRFRADFAFHERHLACEMSDGALTGFNLRYNELPPTTEYRNLLKREPIAVGLAFLIGLLVGVALVNKYAYGIYVDAESLQRLTAPALVYVACLAAAVWAAHRLTTKRFTIVPLQKGVIHVLHGGHHDRVLRLLQQRRLTALRAFAVIDGANAPQAELRRFTWLKDQGAITEPEFEAFSQKLKALSPQTAESTVH